MKLVAVLAWLVVELGNWVAPVDHASCPTALAGHVWWVNGISPNGVYGCRPRSLEVDIPSRGKEPDQPVNPEDDVEVEGQIQCPSGLIGVVVDWQRVACGQPNYQNQTE